MKNKFTVLMLLSILVLIVVFITTLNIGRYSVNLIDVFNIVLAKTGLVTYNSSLLHEKEIVFWNLRLTRVIFAACVGCALSVSGAVLQALFRNPLAAPDIVGVTQGANFGAAFAILFLVPVSSVINACSFVFGLVAVILAYIISRKSSDKSVTIIVLIGIIMSSIFQAGLSFLIYIADPYDTLPKITYRLMGSLQDSVWKNITFSMPVILIGVLILIVFSWRLNVMSQSDEEAFSLGVDIHKWRFLYIFLSTLIVASAVSICGNIMWVGLIVPHIARFLIGPENRKLIPFTAVLGAVFMMIIDTIVRSATAGEIPISIITSLIGAPFLGFLVLRKKRGVTGCQ